MWFGNTVTMEWWTHLWLNEGFARFMEHVAVDHIFPQWQIWNQYGEAVFALALSLDSLDTTHPVEVPVGHPDEVNEIFDTISYAKGSAIIRMLQTYLGADVFDRGIQGYIHTHKWSNALSADLWAALSEAAGFDVAPMMKGWTTVEGFPLLVIDQVSSSADHKEFKLAQKRFQPSAAPGAPSFVWQIPVVIETSWSKEPINFIMSEAEQTISIPCGQGSAGGWIKFNAGQTGFFRSTYTAAAAEQADGLAEGIRTQSLGAVDRLGVISDAFACLSAGYAPAATALALISCCSAETDLYVWKELSAHVRKLMGVFADEQWIGVLRNMVSDAAKPTADRLGWTIAQGESELDTQLRATILGLLTAANDESVAAAAAQVFAAGSYSTDLRPMVLRLAVKNGGKAGWDTVKALYSSSEHPEEKRDALVALASSTDAAVQEETFQWALFGGQVRNQDLSMVLRATTSSARAAWSFFTQNFDTLASRYVDPSARSQPPLPQPNRHMAHCPAPKCGPAPPWPRAADRPCTEVWCTLCGKMCAPCACVCGEMGLVAPGRAPAGPCTASAWRALSRFVCRRWRKGLLAGNLSSLRGSSRASPRASKQTRRPTKSKHFLEPTPSLRPSARLRKASKGFGARRNSSKSPRCVAHLPCGAASRLTASCPPPPSPLSFSPPATLLSGCPYPRPPLSWKHPQRLTYVTYVSCAGTPHANQCDHI